VVLCWGQRVLVVGATAAVFWGLSGGWLGNVYAKFSGSDNNNQQQTPPPEQKVSAQAQLKIQLADACRSPAPIFRKTVWA
jgi:hypothetical protein